MVVKSYEQMTDVSIMEVKTYLLIHSDGIYQQDIYDLMNTCIDVFQLNRTLSIQYIDPFQYKTTSHTQELDHTPPYKDTKIYKKPAFKCQR